METFINLVANMLIVFGMTFFIIGVFGRRSDTIEKLPWVERVFLKVALSATASGALFNMLTASTPNVSEIILNFGMGLLFTWTSFFHWKYFVKKKKN